MLEIFVPKTSVIFLNVISIFYLLFGFDHMYTFLLLLYHLHISLTNGKLYLLPYMFCLNLSLFQICYLLHFLIFFCCFSYSNSIKYCRFYYYIFVCGTTSVSSPPITPANPIDFSLVEITMSFSSNVLSILSNVVSFSPFLPF